MKLTRDKIQRMVGSAGYGSSSGSGGGGGSMAGYATMAWVSQNYISIDFFSQLFKVYKPGENTGDPDVEVEPNTIDEDITNIKAMFGFWTEQYLSALGNGPGGGGGGGGGISMSDVWNALAASDASHQIDASHLTTAAAGLFTSLAMNGNDLSMTIGGTTKTLTVGYASIAPALLTDNTLQMAADCFSYSNGLHFYRTSGTSVSDMEDGFILQWAWGENSVGQQLFLDDAPTGMMRIRGRNLDGTYTDWLRIYTDNYHPLADNATKLQTARTLWGQSFDGTANVTGALTGVTDITASGTITGATLAATTAMTLGGKAVATQEWVGQNYVSIAFFSRLFQAYNGSTAVNPNDTTTAIDNIKAMFGFWTDQYLTALGKNPNVQPSSLYLSQLADVSIPSPTDGQVLTYSASVSKWIASNASSGTDMSTVWANLAAADASKQIDISHLTTALSGYLPLTGGVLTGKIYLPKGQKLQWDPSDADINSYGTSWYGLGGYQVVQSGLNVEMLALSNYWGINLIAKDDSSVYVNGNTIIHTGNIGSQLSGYLPLTGGTLTGTTTFNNGCWVISANEVNEISSKHWENTTLYDYTNSAALFNGAAIKNALRFRWYDTYWNIGNIRGDGTESFGFGIALEDTTNNRLIDIFHVNTGGAYICGNTSLHTGNYSNYALPLTGGNMTGRIRSYTSQFLQWTSYDNDVNSYGTSWYGLGNYNVSVPDVQQQVPITALSNYWGINLIAKDNSSVYVNGNTIIHSGNIASQSVAYATSAGDAATLGGTAKSGLFTALSSTWASNLSATIGGTTLSVSSLNADYAGQLRYTKKIWGQNFNGTADVSGDLYLNGSNLRLLDYGGSADCYIVGYQSGSSRAIGVAVEGSALFEFNDDEFYSSVGIYSTSYITALSDIRFKDVIRHFVLDAETIANASIIQYRRKDIDDKTIRVGGIAQEWQKILPETVHEAKDGKLSMDYSVIAYTSVVSLAKKVVEQKQEIDDLKRKNEILEKRLERIEAYINSQPTILG